MTVPIFIRRSLFSIFMYSLSTICFGAGITEVNLSPSEVLAPTNETLIITAVVLNDSNNPLLKTSVQLIETTSQGAVLSFVGSMYDDGTHGDAIPGDGIYTATLPISETRPIDRFFQVSAAYSGLRNRAVSMISQLRVVPELPDAVEQQVNQIATQLTSTFAGKIPSLGLTGARTFIANQAASYPNIGTANVSLSGSDLSLAYVYVDPASGYVFRLPMIVSLADPSIQSDGAGLYVPTALPPDSLLPSNDKALLYAPGYSLIDNQDAPPEFRRQNIIVDHALAKLRRGEYMSFTPQPLYITQDSDASLQNVKSWGDYGTIIIHSHGNVFDYKLLGLVLKSQQVVFGTGTSIFVTSPQMKFDFIAGRTAKSGNGFWAVFPSYIAKYVPSGSMKGTFVYLGLCKGLANDSLWSVLKSKGAAAAVGFDGEVSRSFNLYVFDQLASNMLPDTNTNPLSLGESFAKLPSKVDVNFFPGTSAKKVVASPSSDLFTFAYTSIKVGKLQTSCIRTSFPDPYSYLWPYQYGIAMSGQVTGEVGTNFQFQIGISGASCVGCGGAVSSSCGTWTKTGGVAGVSQSCKRVDATQTASTTFTINTNNSTKNAQQGPVNQGTSIVLYGINNQYAGFANPPLTCN